VDSSTQSPCPGDYANASHTDSLTGQSLEVSPNMRNVLVVAVDFPPQGGSGTVRLAKFVKYLPEFGWLPTVVCLDNVWNYDPSLLRDVPPSVRVHRVPLPALARSVLTRTSRKPRPAACGLPPASSHRLARTTVTVTRALLQPDTLAVWVPSAVRICSRLLNKTAFDAILTSSPPHSTQLIGWLLRGRFPQIPWIADYRDPWSESHVMVSRIRKRANRLLEGMCHRRASRVIVVTEGRREQTLELFPSLVEEKLIAITNGFDPADYYPTTAFDKDRPLTLSFVGSLYEGRRDTLLVPALLELAAKSLAPQQLQVRFVGTVSPYMQRSLQPLIDVGLVKLIPFLPRDQALAEMAAADALLLLESDIPELRLCHSNKLFEYLATGNPILAIAGEGETSALLRQAPNAVVVHPGDKEGIKTAILNLQQRGPRRSRDQRQRADLLPQFHRRTLTQALAEVLEGAAIEQSGCRHRTGDLEGI